MYVATVDKKGRANTVVLTSDAATTTVWRQPKTSVRPGFPVDEVVEILRDENDTWGIPSAGLLTVVAEDTMPAGEERVWTVGTPVSQALSDMEVDASFDVDLSYNLQVWAARGTDLSATVALVPGADPPTATMNIAAYGFSSDPAQGTRAVVLTNDGFVEVIDATAEAALDARGMYLESGSSGSIAKGTEYALDAIAQSGRVRRNYQAEIIAVAGARPELDFTVADTIAALDYQGAAVDLQVLSLGGTSVDTFVSWSLELSEPGA
jgi:hypothetical protein